MLHVMVSSPKFAKVPSDSMNVQSAIVCKITLVVGEAPQC